MLEPRVIPRREKSRKKMKYIILCIQVYNKRNKNEINAVVNSTELQKVVG
jgi:hypothetical protein